MTVGSVPLPAAWPPVAAPVLVAGVAAVLVAAALFFILAVRVRSGYFESREALSVTRQSGQRAAKAEAVIQAAEEGE